MNIIYFNDNLKFFREKKGLSGKSFAQLLDIPYTTYMNYENKGGEPKFEILLKMAEILNTSTDELLGYKQDIFEERYLHCKQIVIDAGFDIDEIQEDSIVFTVIKYEKDRVGYVKKHFIELIEEFEKDCTQVIEPASKKLLKNTIKVELFNILKETRELE